MADPGGQEAVLVGHTSRSCPSPGHGKGLQGHGIPLCQGQGVDCHQGACQGRRIDAAPVCRLRSLRSKHRPRAAEESEKGTWQQVPESRRLRRQGYVTFPPSSRLQSFAFANLYQQTGLYSTLASHTQSNTASRPSPSPDGPDSCLATRASSS